MCGRFARRSTREVLAEWFGIDPEDMPAFSASYNIAPQSVQPIVRQGRDSGAREFVLMRWGLVPFWAKDEKVGFSTINARAEEAASKPAFREALRKRRCLIPADAFYEWTRCDAKSKEPFAFALANGGPFAFAGLWDRWRPKDGEAVDTFTILTTDANQVGAHSQPHARDSGAEGLQPLAGASCSGAIAGGSSAPVSSGTDARMACQRPGWECPQQRL